MLRLFGTLSGITMTGLFVAALTVGGFDLDDPEMEEALYWARDFKAEQPEVSRALAMECAKELTSSPYFTRDGAFQLFQCVRREAEAQGFA